MRKENLIVNVPLKIVTKRVSKSKDLFKVKDSWSMRYELLQLIPNMYQVEIYDTEERKYYLTTAGIFKKKGQVEPFGTQILLALKEFEIGE